MRNQFMTAGFVIASACTVSRLSASALVSEVRRNEVSAVAHAQTAQIEVSGVVTDAGFATPDRLKVPKQFRGRPFIVVGLGEGDAVACLLSRDVSAADLPNIGAAATFSGQFVSLSRSEAGVSVLLSRCR